MSFSKNIVVTGDSPAGQVLDMMLGDHVRYPCLSAMIYQLAESLGSDDPGLAADCWAELNKILSGQADPANVREFAARHGAGWSAEARAFRAALLYLISEDEGRRNQYLALEPAARHDFIKCRLWRACEIRIEQGMAI